MFKRGVLRRMIDNAFAWAKENGKYFVHKIHGAEMISIDVKKIVRRVDESGERMCMTGRATLEDENQTILDGRADDAGHGGGGDSMVPQAPSFLACMMTMPLVLLVA